VTQPRRAQGWAKNCSMLHTNVYIHPIKKISRNNPESAKLRARPTKSSNPF